MCFTVKHKTFPISDFSANVYLCEGNILYLFIYSLFSHQDEAEDFVRRTLDLYVLHLNPAPVIIPLAWQTRSQAASVTGAF